MSRGTAQLLKEHGPFTHLRKVSAAPAKPPKKIKEPASEEGREPEDNSKKAQERIIYTDASGVEFEVTADRKRKLQVRGGEAHPLDRGLRALCGSGFRAPPIVETDALASSPQPLAHMSICALCPP